jgi:integral membrane protein (TIGR01906 family)
MTRLQSAFSWLITIIIPFLILMSVIRLLFNPIFVDLEYNAPGFPADSYGFTLQDRLHYSQVSIEYLLNSSDISFLANQQLADGSPLYNSRELSHMADVKNVLQGMITAWYLIIALLSGLGLFAYWNRWQVFFWQGVSRGGWSTVGLIGMILAAVAISFNSLFTGFHEIFFKSDTWLFLYSDSLIRLFPLRLWQDAFIAVGVISLAAALIFIWVGHRLSK